MRTLLVIAALLLMVASVSAGTYYVAKGDPFNIPENKSHGTCWYFPTTGVGQYYDIPAKSGLNQSYCSLTADQTSRMLPGQYNLLYIEPVFTNNRYFIDVAMDNDTLISSFANERIDESGRNGALIQSDVERLVKTSGFNIIRSDRLYVNPPDIKINSFGQKNALYYTVEGTSNRADGTPVTVYIDEMRYYAQQNNSFMKKTQVYRSINTPIGTWKADILMDIDSMPVGWKNITVYCGELKAESQFRVNERNWQPGPTPTQCVKYLNNGDIAPEIIIKNVTVIQTVIEEKWHTATPTPPITDALGDTINYPYSSGEFIPPWFAILSLICMAGIIMCKGWTRK